METQDPIEQIPATQKRRTSPTGVRRWLKVAGWSLALLAASGAGVVFGMSTLAAQAATPTPASTNAAPQAGWSHMAGIGGPRHGAPLTVTSVQGTTVDAKAPNGTTVTIKTSASTQYTRAGQTVSASALATGDNIRVQGTRQSDGTITASHIDILLPAYAGTVTSVNGTSITVQDRQGTHTIITSASTTFMRAGQKVSLSAVTSGEMIAATGTLNSDGSLNAQVVEVLMPRAAGQITQISGTTIVVQNPRGTQTIHVSASTQYNEMQPGTNGPTQTSTTLSALKVGMHIVATGTQNSDGSLNAQQVSVMSGTPQAGMGAGHQTPAGWGQSSSGLSGE